MQTSYYEEINMSVVRTGLYALSSNSSIDTYCSIYINKFDPLDLSENLFSGARNSCIHGQLEPRIRLYNTTTYILVVKTFGSNETGAFSIIVSGPNTVNFNRMSKYSNYLMNK
jgi:hypothetical protein